MRPVQNFKHSRWIVFATLIAVLASDASAVETTEAEGLGDYGVRLVVTTPLAHRNVPMDATIDFQGMIAGLASRGVLNPYSIQLF